MSWLPIFGAGFAAFAIWLVVRIISRREGWAIELAIWLMIPLLALAVLRLFFGDGAI